MKKVEKENQKIDYLHEIQQTFRYHYRNEWVNQSFINKHNRLWIKAFNDLVKEGFIKKKKTVNGYSYKWAAEFPKI